MSPEDYCPEVTVNPSPDGAAVTSVGRAGSGLPERTLVLSSVMFAFIGIWPTAAVVLCDLASTAYYIGGIVESQIGKAAPWFILAVMLFSYAVRSFYIESCSMFVRGGVYRVVKEAMGHRMAKVSVSALMFDYVLTGPISAVSAGHYLVKLLNSLLRHFQFHFTVNERWGAAASPWRSCSISSWPMSAASPRRAQGTKDHVGDDLDGGGDDRLVPCDLCSPT